MKQPHALTLITMILTFVVLGFGFNTYQSDTALADDTPTNPSTLTISGIVVNNLNKAIKCDYTITDSATWVNHAGRTLLGRFRAILTTYGAYYVTFNSEGLISKTVKISCSNVPQGKSMVYYFNVRLQKGISDFINNEGTENNTVATIYYDKKIGDYSYRLSN